MGFEMQPRGRDSPGQFWWRAAEPIPARPTAHGAGGDGSEAASEADAPLRRADPGVARVPAAAARVVAIPAAALRLGIPDRDADISSGTAPGGVTAEVNHEPQKSSRRPSARRPVGGGRSRPRPGLSLLRRRHVLLAASAGALLFAGVTGFGQHVRAVGSITVEVDKLLIAAGLGINEISLSGHRHTLDQDIFRAIGAPGTTLLSLDVGAARTRIEALPWVASATLVRVFPDKLKVDLRERVAAAVWLDGERTALVDADGRVLAHVASFVPPELPRIAGPGAPAAAAELLAALPRAAGLAERVHLARRIGQRRWDLELVNGTRVRLAAGAPGPSLERLARLHGETAALDKAGNTIDLTMPRSIAVSGTVDPAERRAAVRVHPARPL